MNGFRLRFAARRIAELAEAYDYPDEPRIANVLTPPAKERGFFTESEFFDLATWKAGMRIEPNLRRNGEGAIEEATRIAFSARSEQIRIGVLRCLDGVDWPVASCALHFGHIDPYPMLDWRALAALGIPRGTHVTFDLWWDYVVECRRLADRYGVTLRTLDKALWKFGPG